jgi:hypothetical protein
MTDGMFGREGVLVDWVDLVDEVLSALICSVSRRRPAVAGESGFICGLVFDSRTFARVCGRSGGR